jgi:hypothetical protein
MSPNEFEESLALDEVPQGLSAPLAALWWDARGDWPRAHELVDQLGSTEAWRFMPTCTAGKVHCRMRTTGIAAPDACIIAPRSKRNGGH